ncbi:hypothetical protein ACQ4PT_050296 [Festuca glaucescens]
MAHTRSGGANNDGAGDTGAGPSTRKGGAAAKAKDSNSAATSSSSATARESRSSSARETSDAQQPNLRRSNRETRGKHPNLLTTASPASTPQKSTRGRSRGSTPETPESSAKKLKGVAGLTGKASTTRMSDRVKKASVSASTASNDSNGMSSPVASPHKTAKRQTDEHNSMSNKHDATESGTRPSKKQKRLTAKSYAKLFRPSSEEKEKSPGLVIEIAVKESTMFLVWVFPWNVSPQTIMWRQEWVEPHRLLKKRSLMPQKEAEEYFHSVGNKLVFCNVEWLVKWKDLGYEHVTWELETSSFLCTPEAEELKRSYEIRREAARKASDTAKINKVKQCPFQKLLKLPDGYPPGLDNVHLSSLNQLREFWHNCHGAILVDDKERVIKTILFAMSILPDVCRPLLIVTTSASLALWEAKFNRLAPSINVVVYNGEKDVRKTIQDLEFYEKDSVMLQVLLSHPDAIIEENILDYINLLSFLNSEGNDISSILNVDLSIDTPGTIVMLKSKLKLHVAFERKGDSSKFVEYWVPARLSRVQLEIYCHILLSNSPALQSHSRTDSVGALRDILVSLRKCCDHPYLVDETLQVSLIKGHPVTDILDIGVHASGKLVLLDKMLREIREKGLRVIILSQSGGGAGNPMGDILDDFFRQRFGLESYERVERGLHERKKQSAMIGKDKDSMLPEIKTISSSQQISVDDTWQEQGVENLQGTQKGLHIQLKPELSKLYKLLELPESVICLCEELLEYTLKNHQVSQEPKGILHAFNIALCWRAASLLKHKVSRRESLALAANHLNYECNEDLAEFVYEKLRILKKKFSRRVGETSKHNRSTLLKSISPIQQETSTKLANDESIPNQVTYVDDNLQNGSSQENPHDLLIEAILPREKELPSVPEFHEKQHLSKDALVNRITEKKINLVNMVFSLREKNIHDKQASEVAVFTVNKHKGVLKLREACKIVVEHLRRSYAGPDDRDAKIKLIVEWFTMLLYAFLEHMRYQREKLDLQQSTVWAKELLLKGKYLQEAKLGQLDHTFDQDISLPDSGFVMEEFNHFSCCVDTANLANCQQSLNDTSVMEITLVRSVIPSEVINAGAARDESAETFIQTERRQESEDNGLTEKRVNNSSDCTDSQGGTSLAIQHTSSSNPAIDSCINQDSSTGDHRSSEHVEGETDVSSQPLLGCTNHHLGDAEMEVNTCNSDSTLADPPHLEPQTVDPVASQVSEQMSKEVETRKNLVMQPAQSSIAPAQLLQREAEQAGLSGEATAQILQPEMQSSVCREVDTQRDLIIQSAQPSMVPAQLSEEVEQAALSRVPSAQRLLSGMQPSIPASSILLERTHPNQSQQSNQPEDAPGSSAQLFSVASMMFNHPPVGDEPLKNELHRLRLYIDSLNKTHELKQSQLQTECSQEIEKVKQKYDLLLQEQDSTHLQQRKTLDGLCQKVLLNQSLADDFQAKFISSSGAQGRAHSPPNHQIPQVPHQVPTRPSAVTSSSAARPPVPIHHVQPLQADRPSSSSSQVSRSSSPSLQVPRPRPSIPGNIVRSTSVPFSHTPVLPRGSFGLQSELARAPAPHLQRRLLPLVHSLAPANQQQLPTRLEGSTSARTQSIPVTPVHIRQPSPSSLHLGPNPVVLAPLGPSSSRQVPSSSHPTRLPSPVSSVPNPALQLSSPPGFTRASSVSPATSDVLSSRRVGPSSSGTPQSDSDSISLDEWLTESHGLSSDPRGSAAPKNVVCLSDDE